MDVEEFFKEQVSGNELVAEAQRRAERRGALLVAAAFLPGGIVGAVCGAAIGSVL